MSQNQQTFHACTAEQGMDNAPRLSPTGLSFYDQFKEWLDWQNQLVEDHGMFGQEYRVW